MEKSFNSETDIVLTNHMGKCIRILHIHNLLVFGLSRIFRLERSAIFMTQFRARLELGAMNFHLKPCMFTWAGEIRFSL